MPRISEINRALMVGQYQQGATMQAIANRFNVSKAAVCQIIRKHRETGYVKDRPRSGRPRATTPRRHAHSDISGTKQRHFMYGQYWKCCCSTKTKLAPTARYCDTTVGFKIRFFFSARGTGRYPSKAWSRPPTSLVPYSQPAHPCSRA